MFYMFYMDNQKRLVNWFPSKRLNNSKPPKLQIAKATNDR